MCAIFYSFFSRSSQFTMKTIFAIAETATSHRISHDRRPINPVQNACIACVAARDRMSRIKTSTLWDPHLNFEWETFQFGLTYHYEERALSKRKKKSRIKYKKHPPITVEIPFFYPNTSYCTPKSLALVVNHLPYKTNTVWCVSVRFESRNQDEIKVKP